ncbi:MAG: hypothetical protein IIY16_06710 [Oscillospiraceae bacterium]|nr:hypothetical protein [Oscillospiraceae bacterium]
MKRFAAILLCAALLLLPLTGCKKKAVKTPDVLITIGEVKAGMAVGDIEVSVTFDGQPAEYTTEWIVYSDKGYDYLNETDLIPDGYEGRVDIRYSLPKGVENDGTLPVRLEAFNGTYDGTGDMGYDDNGCAVAWSHVQFALAPETDTPEVLITVGEITPGMTVGALPITVTIDGEEVEYRHTWTATTDAVASEELTPEAKIPAGNSEGRLDIYYYLPQDVAPENIDVTVDAPGGRYESTAGYSANANREFEVCSTIAYTLAGEGESDGECEVLITVGEVKPGMTADSVEVSVTVNDEEVECQTDWILFTSSGYRTFEGYETIPQNFNARLDVTYFLPLGVSPADAQIEADAPGGYYDGTGIGVTNNDGQIAAWSHIRYEAESEADPDEEDEKPETPEAPEQPAPQQPTTHTHNWQLNSGLSMDADCSHDGWLHMECSCGQSYDEAIPASGHSWSPYTPNGADHMRFCGDCGATENGAHVFPDGVSGTCSVCGAQAGA